MSSPREEAKVHPASVLPQTIVGATSAVIGFLVFCMMALTFANVIGRYILNSPIPGAFEISGFLLGLVVFAGTIVVTKDQRHIVIGLLDNKLSVPWQRFRHFLVMFWTEACVILIAILMWREADAVERASQLADTLNIQVAPLYYAIACLATLTALMFPHTMWREWTRLGSANHDKAADPADGGGVA